MVVFHTAAVVVVVERSITNSSTLFLHSLLYIYSLIICRGDPMKVFAQFFGGEDPFATFFQGGGGGGMGGGHHVHVGGPGGSQMFFNGMNGEDFGVCESHSVTCDIVL